MSLNYCEGNIMGPIFANESASTSKDIFFVTDYSKQYLVFNNS